MRGYRLNQGFLVIAGWLALLAHASVALQAGWHHHGIAGAVSPLVHKGEPRPHEHDHDGEDPASADHGCALCVAIAGTGFSPVAEPELAALAFLGVSADPGRSLPAFLAGRPSVTSRGPPGAA